MMRSRILPQRCTCASRRTDGWPSCGRPSVAAGDRVRFGHAGNACFLGELMRRLSRKPRPARCCSASTSPGRARRGDRCVGHIPLPPYIAAKRADDERDRADYQKIYAREEGASPRRPRACISRRSCSRARQAASTPFRDLHVGAGTSLPVKADDTADHRMHAEGGSVSRDRRRLNRRKATGGRIVAVGTTSLRLLESAARRTGRSPWSGRRISSSPPAIASGPSIC